MFQIDIMSRTPVYEQIISQMEHFVLCNILKANDQLPSVRSLSVQLSTNPNTIQKAYTELDRRGIIYSVPGKGCFVAQNAKSILGQLKRTELPELENKIYEFVLAGVTEEEFMEILHNAMAKAHVIS